VACTVAHKAISDDEEVVVTQPETPQKEENTILEKLDQLEETAEKDFKYFLDNYPMELGMIGVFCFLIAFLITGKGKNRSIAAEWH